MLSGLLSYAAPFVLTAGTAITFDPNGNTLSQQSIAPGGPTITGQPISLPAASPGAIIGFSVTIASPSPVTYQWYCKGDIIPGATGDSLLILGVSNTHLGDYSVIVTNASGNVTSQSATLAFELSTPAAPNSLVGSALSSTVIELEWGAVANATEFFLERTTDGTVWTALDGAVITEAHFVDTTGLPETRYGYRVRSANEAGESIPTAVTWVDTYSGMEYWRVVNFGTTDDTGAAAALAKSDGATTNLERYAFGFSATDPVRWHAIGESDFGLPTAWLNVQTAKLRIEYIGQRAAARPGVRYEVQFSANLTSWTSGGLEIERHNLNPQWERIVVEDNESMSSTTTTRFTRVKITTVEEP